MLPTLDYEVLTTLAVVKAVQLPTKLTNIVPTIIPTNAYTHVVQTTDSKSP